MRKSLTYLVPGIHCDHCQRAIKDESGAVRGVELVDVELPTKVVTVHGQELSDEALRRAIHDAGYEAA